MKLHRLDICKRGVTLVDAHNGARGEMNFLPEGLKEGAFRNVHCDMLHGS